MFFRVGWAIDIVAQLHIYICTSVASLVQVFIISSNKRRRALIFIRMSPLTEEDLSFPSVRVVLQFPDGRRERTLQRNSGSRWGCRSTPQDALFIGYSRRLGSPDEGVNLTWQEVPVRPAQQVGSLAPALLLQPRARVGSGSDRDAAVVVERRGLR